MSVQLPPNSTGTVLDTVTLAAKDREIVVVGDAVTAANLAVVSAAGAVKVDGSAVTQPVSGTVTSNVGTTGGLALDATLSAVQPRRIQDGVGSTLATVTAGNALKVDGSAVTQPVSGTVTSNIGTTNGLALDATVSAVQANNNAAAPAQVIADGAETATQTATQPAAATAGNMRRLVASTDGSLYTRPHGPVIWSCGLNAIGATLTQCQAAPGAGLRLYVTDVVAQSNTATAGLFTLRFGTGSNCGTGTGNLFFNSASALLELPSNVSQSLQMHFVSPIAVTANNALCVLGVATNTTNIQINGYIAP